MVLDRELLLSVVDVVSTCVVVWDLEVSDFFDNGGDLFEHDVPSLFLKVADL